MSGRNVLSGAGLSGAVSVLSTDLSSQVSRVPLDFKSELSACQPVTRSSSAVAAAASLIPALSQDAQNTIKTASLRVC